MKTRERNSIAPVLKKSLLSNRPRVGAKKRDGWEKAQILISGFSSIALVGVGLYVSSSLQNAQLKITADNNEAQLRLAKEKNAADLRLQELKTATDLMEPLLSSDARKRQIALLMLPRSLSDETMSRKIFVIATADPDQSVRVTAISQMAESTSTTVAAQLQRLSDETDRSAEERKLAAKGAVQVSLRAAVPARSAIFYASAPGNVALESDELGGGLFTRALLTSLSGSGDVPNAKLVTLSQLGKSITGEMEQRSKGRSRPYIEWNVEGSETPFAESGGRQTRALVVGVGSYADSGMLPARYARSDASRVSEALRRLGLETVELLDPTLQQFKSKLEDFAFHTKPGERILIYYTGGGVMLDGESMILMSDSKISDRESLLVSAVRMSDIQSVLGRRQISLTTLFLDICRDSPSPISTK